MRRYEVEETARASSCSEGLEVKFYSKHYVRPLRGFKQKRKRKKYMSFIRCPQSLVYNRCSEIGWMSWDNAYKVPFKQWRVSEMTVIIIWRRIRHCPQYHSLRSQSDYRLLGNEGGNLETPAFCTTSFLLKLFQTTPKYMVAIALARPQKNFREEFTLGHLRPMRSRKKKKVIDFPWPWHLRHTGLQYTRGTF